MRLEIHDTCTTAQDASSRAAKAHLVRSSYGVPLGDQTAEITRLRARVAELELKLVPVIVDTPKVQMTCYYVLKTVACMPHFDVLHDELLTGSTIKRVSYPRQLIMYVLCSLGQHTLKQIARVLNRKHHTTIIHGRDYIASQIASGNKKVIADVNAIFAALA
jgi:chromosomal replication initiation ATPase DnaA